MRPLISSTCGVRRQQFMKAGLQVDQEPFNVESEMDGLVRGEVSKSGIVHPPRSAQVSALKVKYGHGRVNQALIKHARIAKGLAPQFFKCVVACKEFSLVKQPHGFEISRIRFGHTVQPFNGPAAGRWNHARECLSSALWKPS